MRKPLVLLLLLAAGLLLTAPVAAQPAFPAYSQAEVRPVFHLLLPITATLALLWLVRGIVIAWVNRARFALRASSRFVGWMPLLATVGTLALVWLITAGDQPVTLPFLHRLRIIENVIPLAIGLQAAFLFSPEDEPALEVLMACPRPPAWLVLERLGVLLVAQVSIALLATVLMIPVTGEALHIALLRWTAPGLLFTGFAIFISLRSRNVLFGLLLTGVLWFAMALFQDAFVPGYPMLYPLNYLQPFAWGVHPYMQPAMLDWSDYLLNRGLVASGGILLLAAGVRYLRDSERVLLGASNRQVTAFKP